MQTGIPMVVIIIAVLKVTCIGEAMITGIILTGPTWEGFITVRGNIATGIDTTAGTANVIVIKQPKPFAV